VSPPTKESDLIGDFTIKATLDTQEAKANKPVNLNITIEGKGNLESFEFPKYEIDGVTVYTDEAKIENSVVDKELRSTYSKSFAFISDKDFTIPERNFSVLTPKEDLLKTLSVQSYDISIKQSESTQTAAQTSQVTHGIVQTNIEQPVQTKEIIVEKQVEVKSVSWWMLVAAFDFGVVSILILQWVSGLKRIYTKKYNDDEALKLLYAHVSEDIAIEEMVRKMYAKKNGDKSIKIDKKVLKEMIERFR
jgi:hypothetical protein